MTHTDNTKDEPPIAAQLLAYLNENPQAQDTLEGMVWWLLEQRVRFYTTSVKQALAELVAEGLVLEHQGPDGRLHYRLNRRRARRIRERLRQA